ELLPRVFHLEAVDALEVEEARLGELFAVPAEEDVMPHALRVRHRRDHADQQQHGAEVLGVRLHTRHLPRRSDEFNAIPFPSRARPWPLPPRTSLPPAP